MPERFPVSEMRLNPGVIWRKITSMAKYLPVAVGAAAVGRLAMSPNVAIEAGISSFCVGQIYSIVSGENEKKGIRLGTMVSMGLGGAATLAANVAGMPEVGGFLTFFEGMAFIGLGERYLLLKAQEQKENSE